MYAGMHACMHACMDGCMHVCIIQMYIHTYIYMYIYKFKSSIHACIHISKSKHTHMHAAIFYLLTHVQYLVVSLSPNNFDTVRTCCGCSPSGPRRACREPRRDCLICPPPPPISQNLCPEPKNHHNEENSQVLQNWAQLIPVSI